MLNPSGKRISHVSLLFLGALAATSGYADTVTYSAVNDFSTGSNPNGPWAYGSEQPLGSGFAPLTQTELVAIPGMQAWSYSAGYPNYFATPYIARNITPNSITAYRFTVPPDRLQMHPGIANYAVVRWTSPLKATTTVHLVCGFTVLDLTAGNVDVHVLVKGVSVFDAIVTPGVDGNFAKDLTVSPGDTIDIAVGGNGDYHGDSTGVQATITATQDAVPAITAAGVTNGATFASGPIAPGEIIAIFGTGIGPDQAANLTLDANGMVSTKIGATRVLVGGVAAPMIYAQYKQVVAVVPYSIAPGSSTTVQVEYNGQTSSGVAELVAAASPAFFTRDSSGKGQVVGIDVQKFQLLGTDNPATPGSTITLWATGEGLTTPNGVDGKPAVAPLPSPLLPVTVTIDGIAAQVGYAGAAPGFVAGVMQLNVTIPNGVTLGDNVPIVLKVGTLARAAGQTLAIH